ncbi:MAG: peptidylprolyl isomerase [Salinarimonas sp.]|nr:peptidylprolyl isomerase [Salinarimonas sp.]
MAPFALALPLALGIALSPAPVAAEEDPDRVVARAGEIEITAGDIAIAMADPALQLRDTDPDERLEIVITYLVDLRLGAQAAEEAGLGQDEEFARRVAYLREKMLLEDYMQLEIDDAVTDEAARELFETTTAGVEPEDEVRARHILVEEEEEAIAVIARLEAGEEFADVAREVSQDPGSARNGGDLGFFAAGRMVAPFSEAAFALEPGEVSDPVETQFGWHVIKVEERRETPLPQFEDMREQIDNFLTRQAQQAFILNLREGVEIERLDIDEEGEEEESD